MTGNRKVLPRPARMGAVPQREADLLPLRWAVHHAKDPEAKAAAEAALQAALRARAAVDDGVRDAVAGLLRQPQLVAQFQVHSCARICLYGTESISGQNRVRDAVAGLLRQPQLAAQLQVRSMLALLTADLHLGNRRLTSDCQKCRAAVDDAACARSPGRCGSAPRNPLPGAVLGLFLLKGVGKTRAVV